MSPIETLYSKLTGVTHHNADGTSRQEIIGELCYNGQSLLLIREPNQYSQDNIDVYVAYQIGYVSPDLAREIAPLIDQGGAVDARITGITGGTEDKPTQGVNVEFTLYD